MMQGSAGTDHANTRLTSLRVCITYILCHIYVGHNPERDEMMAITYHNMGHPAGRSVEERTILTADLRSSWKVQAGEQKTREASGRCTASLGKSRCCISPRALSRNR